jgi:tRNA1Val (adenine37-N6)-methyltransferase
MELTTDTFFNGRIIVKQSRTGYRYSIDAVILAGHVRPRPEDRMVDLGTGCGIIPLILGCRYPGIKIYGVEIQEELATIARSNVEANCLGHQVEIMSMDMQTLKPATLSGPVDMVVSNPPFYRISSGRINPDDQRAIARHELKVTLKGLLEAAERVLKTAGKFVCIYGCDRLVDLFACMRTCRIEPKFMRPIYSRAGTDARLALVEGVKLGNAGLMTGPPLFIYQENGDYTDEIQRMFAPE